MILPYVPPDKRNWQVGERCTIRLSFRSAGVVGGWVTYNYAAIITKVNKKTVYVHRVGWEEEDRLIRKDRIF